MSREKITVNTFPEFMAHALKLKSDGIVTTYPDGTKSTESGTHVDLHQMALGLVESLGYVQGLVSELLFHDEAVGHSEMEERLGMAWCYMAIGVHAASEVLNTAESVLNPGMPIVTALDTAAGLASSITERTGQTFRMRAVSNTVNQVLHHISAWQLHAGSDFEREIPALTDEEQKRLALRVNTALYLLANATFTWMIVTGTPHKSLLSSLNSVWSKVADSIYGWDMLGASPVDVPNPGADSAEPAIHSNDVSGLELQGHTPCTLDTSTKALSDSLMAGASGLSADDLLKMQSERV